MNTITHGNITKLTEADSIDAGLRTGTYDIQQDQFGNYELHHRPPFRLPEKIYGGHDGFSTRCLKTFRELGKGMAVLLSGNKGSGKTLTAKRMAMESGMPVLTVGAPYSGVAFNAFLTDIPCPVMVLIDEFEKLYDRGENRNNFLSLLDGASDNKHLFILTSNDPNIGEYFSNRPGRVRYHRKYSETDSRMLQEMIRDMMPEGKLREALEALVKDVGDISPDSLVCLVQECLIHQEIPAEFLSFFNIETELGGFYDVTIRCIGYVPMPKLSKARKDLAMQFLENFRENGLEYAATYYEEGMACCQPVEEIWHARRSMPFERGCKIQNGQFQAQVNWAERDNSKQTRNFCIAPHQVKDLRRSGGIIHVTTKDGKEFAFVKSAPYGGALMIY